MGNTISTVLEFLAHVGGFLALIFFIILAVKFWKEADNEEA